MGKIKDKNLFFCIQICFILGILSFAYFIFARRGAFTLYADFNGQQIPFATLVNQSLKQRNLSGWTWQLDLGSSLIEGFSFYNLGSPYIWLSLLFPATVFPYLVGPLFVLKYIVAGITAYYYLKLFVKDNRYAVIGAVLYAFSGFQTSNIMFFHFHDVVSFFPLLLLGLEKMMSDKRDKAMFIFAVFLNCLVNYFFFIQEVIFLILYFLIRFWDKPIKMMRNAVQCLICGGIGVGMASVIFIPSILYIMKNPRSETQIYIKNLLCSPKDFLFFMKGILLPGETMNDHSMAINQNWNSTSCYLPLVNIALVISYLKKKRNWLTRLIIILFGINLIPLLSSAFLLFTTVYQRWWYMLEIMLVLASIKVMDDVEEYDIRSGAIINGLLLLALVCIVWYMKWDANGESLVFHGFRLIGYLIFCLIGLIWTALSVQKKKFNLLFCGVCLFSVVTTFSTTYLYQRNTPFEPYMEQYRLGSELPVYDPQYRYNLSNNVLTMTGDAAGIASWSSTVTQSLIEFDGLFDFYWFNRRLDKNEIPGLVSLLGAKYSVSLEETEYSVDKIAVNGNDYYISETDACPIGFAIDRYILRDDLMEIDKNDRGKTLLNAAVVDAEDEETVSAYMKKVTKDTIDWNQSIEMLTLLNAENAVTEFERDGKGFRCKALFDKPRMVYFSVPNDSGWQAFIDGNKEQIINSGGMMLLPVSEGVHDIVFRYTTPGYRLGLYVSIAGWCVFMALVIIRLKRKAYSVEEIQENQ